jgi:hypothetical protein
VREGAPQLEHAVAVGSAGVVAAHGAEREHQRRSIGCDEGEAERARAAVGGPDHAPRTHVGRVDPGRAVGDAVAA